MKTAVAAIGSILVLLIGAGLLLYSPASCSCAETWMLIANEAGLHIERSELTPARLAAGLNQSLAGSELGDESFVMKTDNHCEPKDMQTFTCKVALEQSQFFVRGYSVDFRYDAKGKFQSAKVVESSWQRAPR